MLFSSATFIFGFLPAVLFFYYVPCRKKRNVQNALLTLTSLFFYAWGEPLFVLVMLGVIVLDYVLALAVNKHKDNKKKSKAILFLTVASNLLVFFVFKYLVFTLTNIKSLFNMDI